MGCCHSHPKRLEPALRSSPSEVIVNPAVINNESFEMVSNRGNVSLSSTSVTKEQGSSRSRGSAGSPTKQKAALTISTPRRLSDDRVAVPIQRNGQAVVEMPPSADSQVPPVHPRHETFQQPNQGIPHRLIVQSGRDGTARQADPRTDSMVDLQQEQFQSVADVGTSSMSQSTIRRGASIKLSGSSLLQESTDDAEILKDSGLEEVEPVERDQKQFDHVDTLEDPSKDQRKSRQLDVRQVLVLPSERRERTEAQDCPELPAVAPITHADVEAQKLEEVVDAIPKGSNSADSTQIVPIDATSAESAIVGEPLAEDKGVGVGDEVELVSDFEELDPEAAYGPLGDELTSGTVLSVEVVGGDEIVTVQTTTSGYKYRRDSLQRVKKSDRSLCVCRRTPCVCETAPILSDQSTTELELTGQQCDPPSKLPNATYQYSSVRQLSVQHSETTAQANVSAFVVEPPEQDATNIGVTVVTGSHSQDVQDSGIQKGPLVCDDSSTVAPTVGSIENQRKATGGQNIETIPRVQPSSSSNQTSIRTKKEEEAAQRAQWWAEEQVRRARTSNQSGSSSTTVSIEVGSRDTDVSSCRQETAKAREASKAVHQTKLEGDSPQDRTYRKQNTEPNVHPEEVQKSLEQKYSDSSGGAVKTEKVATWRPGSLEQARSSNSACTEKAARRKSMEEARALLEMRVASASISDHATLSRATVVSETDTPRYKIEDGSLPPRNSIETVRSKFEPQQPPEPSETILNRSPITVRSAPKVPKNDGMSIPQTHEDLKWDAELTKTDNITNLPSFTVDIVSSEATASSPVTLRDTGGMGTRRTDSPVVKRRGRSFFRKNDTSQKRASFFSRGKPEAPPSTACTVPASSAPVDITGIVHVKHSAKVWQNTRMQTVAEILAGGSDDDEWENLDARAIEAAKWTDKEIGRVIDHVKLLGVEAADGHYEVTFGRMFVETANIFDALSGILNTAKKYGVVDFDAEQLWQGQNDDTIIRLLKDTHSGIKIKRRRRRDLKTAPANEKTSGFGHSFSPGAKCVVCFSTIYQAEWVGAGGKDYHRQCFVCAGCGKKLPQSDYFVSFDRAFRCKRCHTDFERSGS